MIYDELFSKYRNNDVSILEIGIAEGGSLELWKTYFGSKAKIYGLDIDAKVPYLKDDSQIITFQGDQSNRDFLRELKTKIPHIDILIDDGSHMSQDQIVTFEELFSHIDIQGLYICEDMHNCWHPLTIGVSFPDYLKEITDKILGKDMIPLHSANFINNNIEMIKSINFYSSLVIIQKYPMAPYLRSPFLTGHKT